MASLVERYKDLDRRLRMWYWGLSSTTRWALGGYVIFQLVITALVIWVGPARIFEILAVWAQGLRALKYGELLLVLLIALTSCPPLIGYGTAQTIAGFAFGVWKGWAIGAAGCLIGATLSFIFCRRMIGLYAPMLSRNSTFSALSTAVRAKGLPLIVLIRLCPFPFPYSNAFFASIETVSLWQFFVATLAITPKLLIHAFIGQRTYMFADPNERNKMDSSTRLINAIYIGLGTLIGAATSYYIYRLTMFYVQEADFQNAANLEAGGLMSDVDELLGEDDDDEEDEDGDGVTRAVAQKRSRQSEDRWDGSMSDFGDQELERRNELIDAGDHEEQEEEDGWGLDMDTIDERPDEDPLAGIAAAPPSKPRRD